MVSLKLCPVICPPGFLLPKGFCQGIQEVGASGERGKGGKREREGGVVMISHVISAGSITLPLHDQSRDQYMLATWTLQDQPREHCMIDTWSLHYQTREQCMISHVISAWYLHDQFMISPGTCAWQPRNQCIISTRTVNYSHVISSLLVTWSVHDQALEQFMISHVISAW